MEVNSMQYASAIISSTIMGFVVGVSFTALFIGSNK